MKDYYQILGVPDDASQEEIKSAFRKLAFTHHPDTSSGDKQQAEEKFKEVNEAYGVLGDENKRRQYDFARKGEPATYDARYGGFQYSQQDIFRDTFSNQAMFGEMSRMFAQAGLRFDRDFLNNVFFQGSGVVYEFAVGPGGLSRRVHRFGGSAADQQAPQTSTSTYQPNWMERLLSKMVVKISNFALRRLFGLQLETPASQDLDQHIELKVSPLEAANGGEKDLSYTRDKKKKRLKVKIPPGIKQGTKIRLHGMGATDNERHGDLYLHIKIKGSTS